jgi:hypothetical protein
MQTFTDELEAMTALCDKSHQEDGWILARSGDDGPWILRQATSEELAEIEQLVAETPMPEWPT